MSASGPSYGAVGQGHRLGDEQTNQRGRQHLNITDGRVIGILLVLFFSMPLIIFESAFASLAPLEIGLLSNDWTSYVDTNNVFEPGLHLVGFGKSFVKFPGSQISMVFTDQNYKGVSPDSGPVSTRTGEDKRDQESGGQQVNVSLSLQYQLPRTSDLGKIYKAFGPGYHERYILITRNTISNVAQEFTPSDFWERRTDVADAMLAAVQQALKDQGMAKVIQLQLLRIDFPKQYEDMITQIQLQMQSKATREYEQRVVAIFNDLSVLAAANAAQAAVVAAGAARQAQISINAARAEALLLIQRARANATRLVAEELGLSSTEVVQYLKLQAIKAHPSERTTLGLGDPFADSAKS